ncbi:hypothetical protein LXL04_037147 [Taraxacum kok-saghyz]
MMYNEYHVADIEPVSKTHKPNFVWNNQTLLKFLDLCVSEMRKGNRPGSYFTKAGWSNLLNDMTAYTGKTFTIKQVKNKWENMKKERKLYDRLMRLETGIGGTRSIIDASPEWWAEKINENKDFAKFKDTDLSIYESHYAPLFRDSIAVGDHSMTPLQFQNNNTNDDEGEEHAEGSGDSDDMHLGDGTPLFRGFPATSTSKRKQKGTANSHKYYVVDAGYPNTRGYLAPYKGTHIRYHLPDFQRGQTAAMRAPRGSQETFNYRHSSLRNIIERTFGVWKARWALLRDMHVNFTYDHQVQIVIASMAVHNYIRRFGRDDGFNAAEQESYNPRRGGNSSEEHDERIRTQRTNDDDMYMAAVRDIIAQDIMELS